jgi:AcrR family transcriptional regulator
VGSQVDTRSASKAATRQRLLDAALQILDEEGEPGLTTVNVTRRAGIAQSSFYVHFSDMDDLLHQLIEDVWRDRGRSSRAARQRYRSERERDRARDTFRVPLADQLAHPDIFRLVLRSRLDPSSPLGEWTRSLLDANREGLAKDLAEQGVPHATPEERRKLEMIADGLIALTDTLALGHLEGRYPNIEEIVDILLLFSAGYASTTPTARRRREEARRNLRQ